MLFQSLQSKENAIVFLDISVDNSPPSRIYLELFYNIAPKTAENFRQLCCGTQIRNNKPIGYKNCFIHRIVKDFVIQGGDFINNNGTGSYSIYGDRFNDENFIVKHDKEGILSMANSGPNSNGCQFFITLAPCAFLNGKHCAFGRVLDDSSMETVRKIGLIRVDNNGKPVVDVQITQCGQM